MKFLIIIWDICTPKLDHCSCCFVVYSTAPSFYMSSNGILRESLKSPAKQDLAAITYGNKKIMKTMHIHLLSNGLYCIDWITSQEEATLQQFQLKFYKHSSHQQLLWC
jgi:hypothetical protein